MIVTLPFSPFIISAFLNHLEQKYNIEINMDCDYSKEYISIKLYLGRNEFYSEIMTIFYFANSDLEKCKSHLNKIIEEEIKSWEENATPQ